MCCSAARSSATPLTPPRPPHKVPVHRYHRRMNVTSRKNRKNVIYRTGRQECTSDAKGMRQSSRTRGKSVAGRETGSKEGKGQRLESSPHRPMLLLCLLDDEQRMTRGPSPQHCASLCVVGVSVEPRIEGRLRNVRSEHSQCARAAR